jgi:hypothetical protein
MKRYKAPTFGMQPGEITPSFRNMPFGNCEMVKILSSGWSPGNNYHPYNI